MCLLLQPLDHRWFVTHLGSVSVGVIRQGGVPLRQLVQRVEVHRLGTSEEPHEPLQNDGLASLLNGQALGILIHRVSRGDPARIELGEEGVSVLGEPAAIAS